MSGPGEVSDLTCRRARRTIHESLDGDRPAPEQLLWLDSHLAACRSCMLFRAEMQMIQRGLQDLVPDNLPDSVLDAIWAQTRATEPPFASRGRPRFRRLAAAAVLVISLVGLWAMRVVWTGNPGSIDGRPAVHAQLTEREMREAAEQARMVLGLTSDALRKTEQAAIHGVLGREVSGALRRVPVNFPSPQPGSSRGSEL